MTDWAGAGFVWVYDNVPKTMIPPWITTLFVQLCSGTERSEQRPTQTWLNDMRARGYTIAAWHWCTGENPELEAQYHATTTYDHGIEILCANMEAAYDAGGNPGSPRFMMPSRYLEALHWDGPLAVTTTPLFASHMGDWQNAGAVTMPQAFPTATEGGYEIPAVVRHHQAWGWPLQQIRPLAQTYAGREGIWPDATVQNAQAAETGVGVTPYLVEAALSAGQPCLNQLRNAIERPTPGKPATIIPGGDTMLIGNQHGINAMADTFRAQWPDKTKPNRDPNNLATWGAIDKWERSQLELVRAHDAGESG